MKQCKWCRYVDCLYNCDCSCHFAERRFEEDEDEAKG